MIHFALVAYLSTLAALGPALCCCNLRHWASGSNTSTCCGKIALPAGHTDGHAHAGHSHGQHGHSHHHSHVTESASVPAKSNSHPQNHDGQSCACGRQSELIAVGPNPTTTLELQNHGTFLFAVPLPVQPQLKAVDESTIPLVRPALLAGREMLRAYQIMRC